MRRIKKVAVLGSGIMGSGIACHLANIGLEVLLLDILPFDLTEDQKQNQAIRNSLADQALKQALKAKLAPLYKKDFAKRITTGNFEDHLSLIKNCDWVIEVVIERLDIKKQLFEKVDNLRSLGTLVTSNTSGIPIHMMAEGRSEDFKKHFCGTHFFNPPRYMRLLEVIPTQETEPAVIDFLMNFGADYLGKQTVLAKDTPAFIANRIGLFSMAKILELTQELDLTIEEVDKLTGPAIGRPKTGTFRLMDMVGLDTADKVLKGIKANCPDDEDAQQFEIPSYFTNLIENNYLGDKTGQGFYQKTKERDDKGRSVILSYDLNTQEYRSRISPKLESLQLAKQIEDRNKRIQALYKTTDKGGELIRRSLNGLFAYCSKRIPEITDQCYSLDDGMKAGFAWELGPFEYWDILGFNEVIQSIEAEGGQVASWVKDMQNKGLNSFYKMENGKRLFYNNQSQSYEQIPGTEGFIILDTYRKQEPILQNNEIILHDIGDGVLCLEFTSKMNAIGEGILTGINQSIDIAEQGDWKALVIGNDAQHFTVGANLMMMAMMAYEQEFDELNMAINLFQQTMMRCRYSSIPVVAATQGYVFGGGCELSMHCDGVVAAAESYIGLVEVGSGLIPGGGGTKEFALRASDSFFQGDVMIPTLIERFRTIAMASVSKSAYEAYDLGYFNHKDKVVTNLSSNIAEAKKYALQLAERYTQPIQRDDILVLGRSGLGALYAAANELKLGGYASDHDIKIAHKVAYVLCGGDLTSQQQVSEQYLLDLEREAFLSLCGEQKTLERIQHILSTGKPLRN